MFVSRNKALHGKKDGAAIQQDKIRISHYSLITDINAKESHTDRNSSPRLKKSDLSPKIVMSKFIENGPSTASLQIHGETSAPPI